MLVGCDLVLNSFACDNVLGSCKLIWSAMFLSDKDIFKFVEQGQIKLDPFDKKQVKGIGYDLRLHQNFRIFKSDGTTHIDVKKEFDVTKFVDAGKEGEFVIHPGQFVLGATYEHIELGNEVAGLLEGRSSLARIGLIMHATAGLIPPGTRGHVTFEMSNISSLPIKLYVGMRVAQLVFVKTSSPVESDYARGAGSKYVDQLPPTASKIWKDFE